MARRNSSTFLANSCRRASFLQMASAELAQLFQRYDTDQDGLISPSELRSMFCKELNEAGIRCSEGDFSRYEEIFDRDQDRQISLPEFQRIMI